MSTMNDCRGTTIHLGDRVVFPDERDGYLRLREGVVTNVSQERVCAMPLPESDIPHCIYVLRSPHLMMVTNGD